MRGKVYNRTFILNREKLYKAVDSKRRQDKISWERLAKRIGVHSANQFGALLTNKRDVWSNIVVSCLMYLKRPLEDFVETEEVKTNGGNSTE